MTPKATEKVIAAEPGTRWKMTWLGMGDEEFEIGPPCQENVGNWVCVSCGEPFQNQLQKDGHLFGTTQAHVLAWNCFIHGPEKP